jgi:hypothetical protein
MNGLKTPEGSVPMLARRMSIYQGKNSILIRLDDVANVLFFAAFDNIFLYYPIYNRTSIDQMRSNMFDMHKAFPNRNLVHSV